MGGEVAGWVQWALGAIAGVGLMLVGGCYWLIWNRDQSQRDDSDKLWAAMESERSARHAFELRVASEYVHQDRLAELAQEMRAGFQNIEKLIDRLAPRRTANRTES
jgi:hypothetical protein